MKKNMKFLSSTILLFCFGVCQSQTLPAFKLISLDGQSLTNEDLKGKNVYINVFESWCSSCAVETPILNQTKQNLNDIVCIAITPAKFKKAEKFQKKYGFDFKIYPDVGELCKKLGVSAYPTHFFVDKDGNLKVIKFTLSVTWITKDYKNGKPSKDEFNKMLFEQNKNKLEDELKKNVLND